jgi:hypothetical protein
LKILEESPVAEFLILSLDHKQMHWFYAALIV